MSLIRRFASKVINTNTATKQPLFTVQAGKVAVVTLVVVRDASTSLAGLTDGVDVGFNSSANDFADTITVTGLTNATKVAAVNASAGTTVKGAAGDVFGALLPDHGTTGTVTVDVYGYTYNV